MKKLNTDAIIVHKPFSATLENVVIDIPSRHDLVIETSICGICTPEQRVYKGTSDKKYPYWGGHELCGKVIHVLNPMSQFKAGDKVILALMSRCGECNYCKNGLDNHCAYLNPVSYYSDEYNGPRGFSRFISVSEYQAFKAPPGLNSNLLALVEPVACVVRSVRSSKLQNNFVAVLGAGTMGLLHSIILKIMGCNVLVFDDRTDDVLRAKKHEVSDAFPLSSFNRKEILNATDNAGISTVFCTRFGIDGINAAIKNINRGGEVILFQSIPKESNIYIDANLIHYSEIKIIGTVAQTKKDIVDAISIMSENVSSFSHLNIEEFYPNNLTKAFEKSMDPNINRVQFIFSE